VVIVVNEDKLSAVLSEFARTLITDFPIQGILDHLVGRIVEVLPVTAAGVTLISAGMAPRYVAASDQSAMRFERLQARLGQGPCLAAYESGEAVAAADLRADDRFPDFARSAVAAGLAAVFTFPLRHGDGRLGALDLYRDKPGDLEPGDMGIAQTLADVAAAYLLNAQAREDARATSDGFHHSALHDPLTGLPNRLLLQGRVEHAAERAQRSHANAAILFADLDRFKDVNDNHGHQAGDELLIAVGQRLSGLIRSGDTLARVSGDEFVFLCEDLHSPADVEILARRIDEAFTRPFVLAETGITVSITASVGMAFAGPGEEISEQLVAEADTAMYRAKRKLGSAHEIVDLRQALQPGDDFSLASDLRAALAQDNLNVAYQPIVRCSDGEVTGVEALLRWTHPHRGAVPGASMVAVADQSGLIADIGVWVLERACRDRGRWLHDHPAAPMDVAVNVSTRQLITPGFCAAVARVLAATAMDPDALILEMAADVFVEDSERAVTVLTGLNTLGVRLALDDLGTSYSSLSYLHRLPIHIVKIDRRFIADIGYAPTGRAVVAAVANLAKALGLTAIAEGVTTQSQRDEIHAIGCEYAQGSFYARPMPASAISSHAIDAHLGAPQARPSRLTLS
jgi:diguanylate cyclase (GGDEF)-like protein